MLLAHPRYLLKDGTVRLMLLPQTLNRLSLTVDMNITRKVVGIVVAIHIDGNLRYASSIIKLT